MHPIITIRSMIASTGKRFMAILASIVMYVVSASVRSSADIPAQVAVAKHLGLMGLRMADSLLVPLNTTQYSLELTDYLDR